MDCSVSEESEAKFLPITIELDVSPAIYSPTEVFDFAGRSVSAFTQRPLLEQVEWGEEPKTGLISVNARDTTATRWTLDVQSSAIWASGEAFTSDELARALARISTCGAIPSLATALRGIHNRSNVSVELEFERPVACLPEMLTADIFAPTRQLSETQIDTLGPYSFACRKGDRVIALRKNRVGELLWSSGPDGVIFVRTDSPSQGIRLFEAGSLDATSNPNLPLHDLNRYRGRRELRTRSSLLTGVLIFAGPNVLRPEACGLRTLVSRSIDRLAVARQAGHLVSALEDFAELWDRPPRGVGMSTRSSFEHRYLGSLSIGFADFDPNAAVVAEISSQLGSNGIQVSLRPMNYKEYLDCLFKPNVDVVYTLIQPLYSDPTALLNGILASRSLRPANPRFEAAVRRAEATADASERVGACAEAFEIVSAEAKLVPIIRVFSKCLISSRAAALKIGADGVLRPPLDVGAPT